MGSLKSLQRVDLKHGRRALGSTRSPEASSMNYGILAGQRHSRLHCCITRYSPGSSTGSLDMVPQQAIGKCERRPFTSSYPTKSDHGASKLNPDLQQTGDGYEQLYPPSLFPTWLRFLFIEDIT